jgi:hypothetical protein
MDVNGNFLTMVGTFTACGCAGGTISSGTVDMNDPAFSFTAPAPQLAITGGSYSVGKDGRGKASLTATTPFGPSIVLDFVLSSGQHGLVTEFDANGSGSGTLDLQSSPTQAQLAGTFVFNLAGISGLSATTGFGIPEATVGSVTLDASGNATGVQDLNNNSAYTNLAIASPSSVLVGTPGTATLGTLHFDVYAIDSTHLKFIETDVTPILVGDVFSQASNSFPSGELAFTMAGIDYSATTPGPLAVGGMMNSNGTTTISAGIEDFNDAGVSNITSTSSTPLAFTGVMSASGGRFLLALSSFENGAAGVTTNPFTFAAYPSTGGTQLLEVDGGGITGGVAYPQSNTSFTSGQGYGLNLSGFNSGGFEEDDIAEFTNTNNALKGLIDVNDQGSPSNPQNLSATYAPDSTNAGRALISSSAFNLASYTLNGTDTIFIELDGSQIGLGSIGLQASAAQGAIATRMAAMRSGSTPRGASWKRKQAANDQTR